jgi:hypothetical protein
MVVRAKRDSCLLVVESSMVTTRRAVTTAVLIACLSGAPLSGTVAASEPAPPASPGNAPSIQVDRPTTTTRSPFVLSDEMLKRSLIESDAREAGVPAAAYGQWGYHGGHRHHGHDNGAAQAAIILGSAAAIAGTAVLIYANRPECDASVHSNDCYGEKVAGGSLLAGGIVSLVMGAVLWH